MKTSGLRAWSSTVSTSGAATHCRCSTSQSASPSRASASGMLERLDGEAAVRSSGDRREPVEAVVDGEAVGRGHGAVAEPVT